MAKDGRLLLCLSSGARPRYRDDIIRALALPKNARLHFRYDQRWIAPTILEEFKDQVGTRVLVAYIDQTDATKTPTIVPCRVGTLRDCRLLGSTSSLEFELDSFAWTDDVPRFNEELRSLAATLPNFDEKGNLSGFYWLPVDSRPSSLRLSDELGVWEEIVNRLAGHEQFRTEPFFYSIQEIRESEGGATADVARNGSLKLKPGREYLVRLYHYHPREAPQEAEVGVALPEGVGYSASRSHVRVDSRYDEKRIRFVTARPSKKLSGYISFSRRYVTASDGARDVNDFELPLEVSGTQGRKLAIGIALGALISSPSAIAILVTPNISNTSLIIAVGIAGLTGLSAGLLAAFGLNDVSPG